MLGEVSKWIQSVAGKVRQSTVMEHASQLMSFVQFSYQLVD